MTFIVDDLTNLRQVSGTFDFLLDYGTTAAVRRVALDNDYDRLRVPHQERFACADCSERKERHRLGLR